MYKKKPLILLRRLAQIGTTFGYWFGLRLADEALERSEQMFKVFLQFRDLLFIDALNNDDFVLISRFRFYELV